MFFRHKRNIIVGYDRKKSNNVVEVSYEEI